jgi:hypothetical protein
MGLKAECRNAQPSIASVAFVRFPHYSVPALRSKNGRRERRSVSHADAGPRRDLPPVAGFIYKRKNFILKSPCGAN